MINDAVRLVRSIAVESNLSADPSIDVYQLVDVLTDKLPLLAEHVAQAQGIAMGLAAKKSMNAEERNRLSVSSALASNVLPAPITNLNAAFRHNPILMTHLPKAQNVLLATYHQKKSFIQRANVWKA